MDVGSSILRLLKCSVQHHLSFNYPSFSHISIFCAFSVLKLDNFCIYGLAFTQLFPLRCTGAKEKSDEKGVNGEVEVVAVAAAPAVNHTGRIFQLPDTCR